jgi:PKD repeat protein
VDVFTTFNDPGVTTSDNYYPNVTQVRTGVPTMNTLGTYTLTYTVTDGAGNSTVVTRTVNVVDRKAPVIQLLGSNPAVVCRFTTYADAGIKLNDNYYSDAQLQGLVAYDLSSLDMSQPGIYIVTFSLTDPSGNKARTVERYVNVVELGCATGVKELSTEAGFKLYPNPNNGTFQLLDLNQKGIKRLVVTDVLGKEVLNQENGSTQIDIGSKAGLYQLIIETQSGERFYTKIVVE